MSEGCTACAALITHRRLLQLGKAHNTSTQKCMLQLQQFIYIDAIFHVELQCMCFDHSLLAGTNGRARHAEVVCYTLDCLFIMALHIRVLLNAGHPVGP